MPVLSQIEAGVVVVSAASRITTAGPLIGPEKECFRCVLSFVPPAKFEYSPPEREVGMLMMGIVGAEMSFLLFGESDGSVARASNVVASFARAYNVSFTTYSLPISLEVTSAIIFAPSVRLPAPNVINRSARAS